MNQVHVAIFMMLSANIMSKGLRPPMHLFRTLPVSSTALVAVLVAAVLLAVLGGVRCKNCCVTNTCYINRTS